MAIKELLARSRDYYLRRASKEIEKNRKGDFSVTLEHNGVPVDNGQITHWNG